MDQTPLQINSAFIPMIEKIATDIATKIVQAALNREQYSVPTVPDHHHNATDSSVLGPESLTPFVSLPSTVGGVVNPVVLGNQVVQQNTAQVGYGNLQVGTSNQLTKGIFTSAPIPVIYGQGVGVDSAFNGGNAPIGSIVAFTNNGVAVLSGLAFKTQFGWMYINADSVV